MGRENNVCPMLIERVRCQRGPEQLTLSSLYAGSGSFPSQTNSAYLVCAFYTQFFPFFLPFTLSHETGITSVAKFTARKCLEIKRMQIPVTHGQQQKSWETMIT